MRYLNPALTARINTDVTAFLKANPGLTEKELPAGLFTSSFSGFDPDITPADAQIQVNAIVNATGLKKSQIEQIINDNTTGRDLGIFGEIRVNVLKCNLDISDSYLRNKYFVFTSSVKVRFAASVQSEPAFLCRTPELSENINGTDFFYRAGIAVSETLFGIFQEITAAIMPIKVVNTNPHLISVPPLKIPTITGPKNIPRP